MAAPWVRVYVFLSSTFNDMHAERDYLVKRVFPELQEWCERRKLRLVDIDLRWGVTEADATRNRNVVQVCLRRIDECRPFFLCLLGQRYGWVPGPADVAEDTFQQFPGLEPWVGRASVTELEIRHAAVAPFHPLGPGAEPAARAFFYFRDPSYLNDLPDEPAPLREVYADRTDEALRKLKAETVPATGRPIRVYRATWREGAGYRTPELFVPLACPSTLPENVQAWRRNWERWAGVSVQGTEVPEDSSEAQKALAFNERLTRGRLADLTFTAPGEGPVPLSQAIIDDLKAALAEQFPDRGEVGSEGPLQGELDQHEEFRFSHGQGYIERPGAFDELDAYVRRPDDRRPFVLTAAGGMGKSALLARWADRHLGTTSPGGGAMVVVRFIGAGDRSTSVDGLLRAPSWKSSACAARSSPSKSRMTRGSCARPGRTCCGPWARTGRRSSCSTRSTSSKPACATWPGCRTPCRQTSSWWSASSAARRTRTPYTNASARLATRCSPKCRPSMPSPTAAD